MADENPPYLLERDALASDGDKNRKDGWVVIPASSFELIMV
jgi:hypothetical protein